MELSDPLTNMFKHHLWANLRLLERCAELTDEQLEFTIVGTLGSIGETLRHITRSEQSYFSRISTGKMFVRDGDAPPLTMAELETVLRTTGEGFILWAPRVKPEDTVTLEWGGKPREVPKTTILTQVINHGTEHRAQIMVTMTQLGVEPPDLQSWVYFDEMDT